MPTALRMITTALRLNGDYQVGQTLAAEDADDGLYALNAMMDDWGTQRLMVYQVLVEEFTLVVGQKSYTIGSSGDFNTTRPLALENSSFIRQSEIDYPLELINQAAYANIPDKFVQTMPSFIYYETSYPLGKIWFDCEPDYAYTLHLASRKQLQSFTNLTTSLSLPPGYQSAIEYSLAERLAPQYGHEPLPSVVQQARNLRRWLKTVNAPNGVLATEVGVMNTNYVWNIWAG